MDTTHQLDASGACIAKCCNSFWWLYTPEWEALEARLDAAERQDAAAHARECVRTPDTATRGADALACGHHASLLVVSAESGLPLFCELCDCRSARGDAEAMEAQHLARVRELEYALIAMRGALKAALATPVQATAPSKRAEAVEAVRGFVERALPDEAVRGYDEARQRVHDEFHVQATAPRDGEVLNGYDAAWYCARCARHVDPVEVRHDETHTVCGRYITDDHAPPAAQASDEGFGDPLWGPSYPQPWQVATPPHDTATERGEAVTTFDYAASRAAAIADPAKGYVEAFYEVARIMGIGAQPLSPATVWEQQMRPMLERAFTRPPMQASEGADSARLLADLLRHVDRETCEHEETHRGGTIWTICDGCGRKWADDEGGFKPHDDAPAVAAARAYLDAARATQEPSR